MRCCAFACFLFIAGVHLHTAAANEPWLHQSREPLIDRRGNVAFEGRRILLTSDTYPRQAARFVEGPVVQRDGDLVQIRFTLDKPDDVLVRVVDDEGNVVRTLGCGVLGPNAPEPFQKDILRQEIVWDGKDAEGGPAPEGCKVQVSLGLAPRLDGFVGYDPGQLLSQIVWLETDPQGRIYVQVGTGRKTDRTIQRFDREGQYIDMPYPSNPETLAALGKQIDEVWPFVAQFDGAAVPHRPRSWPSFAPYSSDWRIPYPMRIGGDGTVYFAESTTGFPRWSVGGDLFRIFTTHTDRFWFLEMMPLMWSMGPFAIDGKGFGYIVTSTADRCTGTYPPTRESLNDPKAPGTIRKVNLKTGRLQADFEYNGKERRKEKSAYLGTTQTVANTTVLPERITGREAPNPADDSDRHFLSIVDLTVDSAGRILVADGWPRRVKVYEASGRFLGEIDGVRMEGAHRRFQDLRGIAWEKDGFYLLATFRDEPGEAYLLKCADDPTQPKVVWTVALDGGARHLAVDRAADPVMIWAGMGHGPASLSRVTDLGDRAGEVCGVGGVQTRHLRYPRNIATGADGVLYVHDRDRESLIRIDASRDEWLEVPLAGAPISMLVDQRNGRLLVSYSLGEHGGYSPERVEEAGFLAFDLKTLERLPFRLEPVYTQEELAERDRVFSRRPDAYYPWAKTYGGLLAGMDAQGNLYVRDADKGQPWHKATPTPKNHHAGVIRKYAPDGTIADTAYCRLFNTGGGVTMDSAGNLYAVELPLVPWTTVVHDFQAAIGHKTLEQAPLPKRGQRPIRTQSGFGHVVKLDAGGGSRDTEAELWAHRGVSCTNAGGCYCDWPDTHLAIDAADRLFVADVDLHMIKVLDTAGNMIARIGRWGNAETVPGPDGDAAGLGFRLIYCLAAAGDHLFVTDKDLRRVAKVRMDYRESKEASVP
ncbi:MAG: hypothetical protein RBS80_27775 [Thermoguttaceae bacterium]|jgi:hypothetical protein|nr:hypothetical protein [Thermoguttaceae bacterium]